MSGQRRIVYLASWSVKCVIALGIHPQRYTLGFSARDYKYSIHIINLANFLSHALKSANETKFWLGLLKDTSKSDTSAINPLLEETKEFANILGSSIATMRGKKKV